MEHLMMSSEINLPLAGYAALSSICRPAMQTRWKDGEHFAGNDLLSWSIAIERFQVLYQRHYQYKV